MHTSTPGASRRRVVVSVIALALLALLAAPALAAAAPAPTVLTIATADRVVPYNTAVSFTGSLADTADNPVTGYTVQLQLSLDGVTWKTVKDITPVDAPYAYQYSAVYTPPRIAWFRFSFAGDATWAASASSSVLVKPQVFLSKPVVPTSVRRGVKFTAYGYLKPRHSTHAAYVGIRCYRKSPGGAWVLKRVVAAPDFAYKSWTKYKARFSLKAGAWKLVARYYETRKFAETSSAAAYIKVK